MLIHAIVSVHHSCNERAYLPAACLSQQNLGKPVAFWPKALCQPQPGIQRFLECTAHDESQQQQDHLHSACPEATCSVQDTLHTAQAATSSRDSAHLHWQAAAPAGAKPHTAPAVSRSSHLHDCFCMAWTHTSSRPSSSSSGPLSSCRCSSVAADGHAARFWTRHAGQARDCCRRVSHWRVSYLATMRGQCVCASSLGGGVVLMACACSRSCMQPP